MTLELLDPAHAPLLEEEISDGKRLVASGLGPLARVWDVSTGLEAFALRGHLAGGVGVAYRGDGSQLVSVDDRGRITELGIYCTGDWDEATVARHAEAVTLLRP